MASQNQHVLLSPGEAALAGSALTLTVYGLAVVVGSLFFDEDLVPTSVPLAGLVMLLLVIGGAIVGGGLKAVRR